MGLFAEYKVAFEATDFLVSDCFAVFLVNCNSCRFNLLNRIESCQGSCLASCGTVIGIEESVMMGEFR